MKFLASLLLVALILIGCTQPTSDTSSSSAPTSTVLQLQASGSWPTIKLGVNALTGKTIKDATVNFAIDSALLNASPWMEWIWDSTGYTATHVTLPTAAKTWTTSQLSVVNSATISATSSVGIGYGFNTTSTTTCYVKEIDISYTDGTKEVLTFPDTSASTIKSVVTTSGSTTTTSPTLSSRIWTYNSGTSAALTGTAFQDTTVSF